MGASPVLTSVHPAIPRDLVERKRRKIKAWQQQIDVMTGNILKHSVVCTPRLLVALLRQIEILNEVLDHPENPLFWFVDDIAIELQKDYLWVLH